jgi:microcystin-dependent protein
MLIGHGTGTDVNGVQKSFNAGSTGGEYEHSLSTSEMPVHSHPYKDTYLFENASVVSSIPSSSKENVGFLNGGLGNGSRDFDNNTPNFS